MKSLPNSPGGAHTDQEAGAGLLGTALTRHLASQGCSIDELVMMRQKKFRNIGASLARKVLNCVRKGSYPRRALSQGTTSLPAAKVSAEMYGL